MLRSVQIALMIFLLTPIFAQKKGQNSLQFPDLVVSDVIAIDTSYFSGYSYAKVFYSQNIEKNDISKEFNLSSILVKKMTNPNFRTYQDYSPYGGVFFDRYDEIFVKADVAKVIEDLGGKSDTVTLYNDAGDLVKSVVNQPLDTNELKGLLFFDKWFFDEEEFKFTKEVLAYCPVRRYENTFGMEESWYYRKIAWFVFPKMKRRKLKKLEKRMDYLGRFEYEFSVENKLLFGKDDENALYQEEIDSPNWNSFARQNIRNIVINRALSGKSKVVDYQTGNLLSFEQIRKNLGYEVKDMIYVNPETGEEKTESVETEIYKEDIKSMIFIEDWYIDRETMRIKKEVKAIAPVRFYTYDGVLTKKKVAFVIYFN